MNKKLIIRILLLSAIVALAVVFRSGGPAAVALANLAKTGFGFFAYATVAGIVDSINPCAFSVLLLTIGFLFSLGRVRKAIIKIGSVYIFGVFLIYLLIGLFVGQFLNFVKAPHIMAKIGASVLVVVGLLNIINDFFPKFPIKLKIPELSHRRIASLMEKASMPAALLLGILVGFFEFPCTGGPYIVILGLLHDQAILLKLKGLLYLLYYNFLFVLPLIAILAIASEESLMLRLNSWKKQNSAKMRLYGGLAAIALGLLILSL